MDSMMQATPQGMVEDALSQPNNPAPNGILRETQEYDEAECALIGQWEGKIKNRKEKLKDVFKRFRDDMDFAFGKQWDTDDLNGNGDKYTANIIQQHIRQRVSALYARNPKVVAKRTERLTFKLWDEKPETLQMVQMLATTSLNPQFQQMAMALQQDIEQGILERQKYDRVAKTLEVLFNSILKEQRPNFKKQMKQLIRRVETVGAAYVKLDFQRVMKPRPDVESRIDDITGRLAHIQTLAADQKEGLTAPDSPEAAELKQALEQLRKEKQIIVREGLVYSFPKTTALIPDDSTVSLEGWLGTEWLAEEFLLTCEQVKSLYKVDVGTDFTAYGEAGTEQKQKNLFSGSDSRFKQEQYVLVWQVYDKATGTMFVIADGYKGYLQRPGSPAVQVEQFFPYLALMFNEMEHETMIFPPSDARILRHLQKEYNRSKEALRQHRIASSPLYASGAGMFDEEDQMNLALHEPHDVLILKGLGEGESVDNKLQQVKKHPIDPNVYETATIFDDMTRVVGTQEAHLGGVSKATATETSIAEDSRLSSLSSNADDLDEFLSEMARLGGQVLFQNMTEEQVVKRVGPGASWPQFTMEEIMEEIYLTVEAGSSGRPNKAAKAAALERSTNLLLSIPGVQPRWLFKQVMETVDEVIDLTDAFVDGQPSIMALNRMAGAASQEGAGTPKDPNMQGGEGGDNAPQGPGNRPGAQPLFPGPNSVQPGQQIPS